MRFTNKKTSFGTTLLLCCGGMQVMAADFEASLLWSRRVEISTPVSGVVEKVVVDAGDKVVKDDVLLHLEPGVFKAGVAAASADLRNRNEAYKEAKRELERMQELYERTMLSEHDLQLAKNALVRAKAEKDQASASLVKAKYDLKYSSVRAPFDAVVLERHAQPGQVISADIRPETLFILAEARVMLARMLVAEVWLERLKKGQQASIIIAGKKYTGNIRAIGLEPVTGTGGDTRYPVDIAFEYSNGILRAGQQAKVEIE